MRTTDESRKFEPNERTVRLDVARPLYREPVGSLDVVADETGRARCAWMGADAEYRRDHDEEWGVPLHGDGALFENLSLEGFQAGLSWITILRKRPRFREAFEGFDPEVVAQFGDHDIARFMADAGIVRNRAKID